MKQGVLAGLMLLASLTPLGVACGSVSRPSAASVPSGATPGATAAAASTLVFVVRPGTDPQAVGHRIAGPSVTVASAYLGGRPRDNLPMGVVVRTFTVPIPPGQAQELLRLALADPGVESAYLQGTPECAAHDPAC